MTHFADDKRPGKTLCGQAWTGVIMNDRPATCAPCSDTWAERTGWSFPLPATVDL